MGAEMPLETSARTAPQEVPQRPARPIGHRASSPGAAAALTLVVFLVSAVALVVRWRDDFTPIGDLAITELTVREVGRHAVLLGPYSRFRWWHPGPILWYLLAIPYRLLGSRAIGISVGAALISGVAAGGVVLSAGRVAGRRAAWWSALVLGIFVWALGPELLRYPWNPYLTVLPVALLVAVVWAAACGHAWAVPTAAVTATFLVQSHVGYAPVAVALIVAGAVVLVLRARAGQIPIDGRRFRRAGVLAIVLLVALWIPPLVEQVQHDPGNVSELVRFFREHEPDHTVSDGASTTYRALGVVPEQLVAHRTGYAVGRPMPAWANLLTIAVAAVAAVVAVRRRLWNELVLLGLTALLAITAVWSVSRIIGEVEPYLVQWIAVVSPLAWIAAGVVFARAVPVAGDARDRRAAVWIRGATAAVVVATVLLASVNAWSSIRALPPDAQLSPTARRFMDRVIAAIPEDGDGPVLVDIADQQAWAWAATAVLELEKAGIPVRVAREHGWLISGRLGTDSDDYARVLTLALRGQPGSTETRQDPGQRLVARGSGVEAFYAPR
jgi:hypothetical protein